MNCPICSVKLQITERQGVEINFCPRCRGIWLDRGALEKIIERSQSYNHGDHNEDEYSQYDECGGYEGRQKKHRKRSFLEDVLDID